MDVITIVIIGLGLFIVPRLYNVIIMFSNLVEHRMEKSNEIIGTDDDVPKEFSKSIEFYESKLQDIGFDYSHITKSENSSSTIIDVIYYNSEFKSYASIQIGGDIFPLFLVFYSYTTDDQKVITVNFAKHFFIGKLPKIEIIDAFSKSVKSMWNYHKERVTNLSLQVYSAQEQIAESAQKNNAYYESMLSDGMIKQSNDCFKLTYKGAFLHTCKLYKGFKRVNGEYRKNNKLDEFQAVKIPNSYIIKKYHQYYTKSHSNALFGVNKNVLFFISLFLFILVFNFDWNIPKIAIFVGVVFCHELGHIFAMKIFGCRNLQILFIPFLGALAMGKRKNPTPFKSYLISLMGPLPGLIIGLIVYILFLQSGDPLLKFFVYVAVGLNWLNLFPITPLDGGNICSTLYFGRFPRLQGYFYIMSIVILLGVSIYYKSYLMIGLLILFALNIPTYFRKVNFLMAIQKVYPKGQNTFSVDELLFKTFNYMQEVPSSIRQGNEFAYAKYVSDYYTEEKASISLIISGSLIYLSCIFLPLIVWKYQNLIIEYVK